MELAEEIPYNIEFLNGEIIFMSQATDLREQLGETTLLMQKIYRKTPFSV